MAKENQDTSSNLPPITNGDQIDAITQTEYGQIKTVGLVKEVEQAYVDYAMSVIVSRALPDVRDGLSQFTAAFLYCHARRWYFSQESI